MDRFGVRKDFWPGSALLLPLVTAGLFLAVPPSAQAQALLDVPGVEEIRRIDSILPGTLDVDPFEVLDPSDRGTELPIRLDPLDLLEPELFAPEALPMVAGDPPQSSRRSTPPLLDFKRAEWGGFAGLVDYSPNFKAKVQWALGLDARVPAPGFPLDKWGIFAEIFLAYMHRDLPSFYNNVSGNWFGGAIGADFTLVRGEVAYLRLQGGIEYSYFNNINSVNNGFGGLLGGQLGFYWIRNNYATSVTISPQFVFNGTDWFILGTVGFQVDF